MRTVELHDEQLLDKESALAYFAQIFGLHTVPHNLDAFFDLLSEVEEEIILSVTESNLYTIAAKKEVVHVIETLLDAIEENPHLHIIFKQL